MKKSVKPARLALVVALAAGVLSSCGEDEPTVMPDVSTRRLDVALSDIERAGFADEVDVIGGGAFGILDESNWTVCDQEPAPGKSIDVSAPRLTVDRECDEGDALEGAADEAVATDTEVEESAPKTKAVAQRAHKPKPQVAETFVMPALAGWNLQDAQDKLQSRDSYLLTQTDATGWERFQVLDSNWKVCWQKPAAGRRVPIETMVDLGAVKLDETCP